MGEKVGLIGWQGDVNFGDQVMIAVIGGNSTYEFGTAQTRFLALRDVPPGLRSLSEHGNDLHLPPGLSVVGDSVPEKLTHPLRSLPVVD